MRRAVRLLAILSHFLAKGDHRCWRLIRLRSAEEVLALSELRWNLQRSLESPPAPLRGGSAFETEPQGHCNAEQKDCHRDGLRRSRRFTWAVVSNAPRTASESKPSSLRLGEHQSGWGLEFAACLEIFLTFGHFGSAIFRFYFSGHSVLSEPIKGQTGGAGEVPSHNPVGWGWPKQRWKVAVQ